MDEGRFSIGDSVTAPGLGIGTVVEKKPSEQARVVGEVRWIYRVRGSKFNPDEWYSESTLQYPK